MPTTQPAAERSTSPPKLVIIAGPNGAGKSTLAQRVLRSPLQVDAFVNADVIAQGLSAFAPEMAALAAGRVMLTWIHELADLRKDFAFETTLASRSFAPWITKLKMTGYEFHLIYLWVDSENFAINRVKDRVRKGGHSVPDSVIERRYKSGILNFFTLYLPLTTSWRLMYNGQVEPSLIAEGNGSAIAAITQDKLWQQIAGEYYEASG